MLSYINLPGFQRFDLVGSGNWIASFYRCGFGSFGKRGGLRGLEGHDLLAKGLFLPDVLDHFLLQRWEKFTLVFQGLHLVIWVFLSFLNAWIPFKVQTVKSTSIVFSGRLHVKNPNRKLQFAAKSQAISGSISVYILCCFWMIIRCQSKQSHSLL